MKSGVIISTRFVPSDDEKLLCTFGADADSPCTKVASHVLEVYSDRHIVSYVFDTIAPETAHSLLERTAIEQQLRNGPSAFERYAACITCYVQLLLKSTNDNFTMVSDLID